jgi:hypothetical protein
MASPSPITDGAHVWVMTGVGQLTCLDFKGQVVWKRDIPKDYGPFGLNHGYAAFTVRRPVVYPSLARDEN